MSHHHQPAPEGKDPVLWEMAQKRTAFKSHVVSYFIVNAFLWGVWYFSGSHSRDLDMNNWPPGRHFPWPIWTTLGWGIGLAFHFVSVYIFPKANTVEREYEKLKNKQKN